MIFGTRTGARDTITASRCLGSGLVSDRAAELRQLTENAIAELHQLIEQANVPPAVFKPACEECSLFDICLPKATGKTTIASRLARHLFQI